MGNNVSLSMREITDGTSNTVALWEVRAGIHSGDFRGTWANGRPAASTVWFHLEGPNDCGEWVTDDTESQYANIIAPLGPNPQKVLNANCMGAQNSGSQDGSGQPRSMHPSGIHGCFCDGSVRFVSDYIDIGMSKGIDPSAEPYGSFANDDPTRLHVWERINASNDGLVVDEDGLDP
jgi:hypothetical protein